MNKLNPLIHFDFRLPLSKDVIPWYRKGKKLYEPLLTSFEHSGAPYVPVQVISAWSIQIPCAVTLSGQEASTKKRRVCHILRCERGSAWEHQGWSHGDGREGEYFQETRSGHIRCYPFYSLFKTFVYLRILFLKKTVLFLFQKLNKSWSSFQ